jgi:hypothetical protein
MKRQSKALSRTADAILRKGAGHILELMSAGRLSASAMLKELGHAFRDVAEAEPAELATLHGAAACVALLDPALAGTTEAADDLVRRAGFSVP